MYLGLNTLFTLIAVYTTPGFPTSEIMLIIMLIFGPAAVFPSEAWGTNGILQLLNTTDFFADFMVFIGVVLPPIVALIIASVLAENPKDAFGAFAFSILLSCGVYAIVYGIGQGTSAVIYLMWVTDTALYGGIGTIIIIFMGGIVNSLFYGALAMLITKAGL
ncbi:MAG: hypothetical protein ACFFKA_13585 [Candidatus Thorarchaeota archaeon]